MKIQRTKQKKIGTKCAKTQLYEAQSEINRNNTLDKNVTMAKFTGKSIPNLVSFFSDLVFTLCSIISNDYLIISFRLGLYFIYRLWSKRDVPQ